MKFTDDELNRIKTFYAKILNFTELSKLNLEDVMNRDVSEIAFLNDKEKDLLDTFGVKKMIDLDILSDGKEFSSLRNLRPKFWELVSITHNLKDQYFTDEDLEGFSESLDSKAQNKVAVFGLDNAGKSSIIKLLQGETDYNNIVNLTPTRQVNIEEIEDIFFWDFGGQEGHRETYLSQPDRFFQDINYGLFVIDVQDIERYEIALEYLAKFTKNAKEFGFPFLRILIHKTDPDFVSDKKNHIFLSILIYDLEEFLSKLDVKYEILFSSIYTQNLIYKIMNRNNIFSYLDFIGHKQNIKKEIIEGKEVTSTGQRGDLQMLSFQRRQLLSQLKNHINSIKSRDKND